MAKVSRAFNPSQIASRVFRGAQTPVSAPGFRSLPLSQPPTSPVLRSSTVLSAAPWLPARKLLSATLDGVPLWLSVPPTKP